MNALLGLALALGLSPPMVPPGDSGLDAELERFRPPWVKADDHKDWVSANWKAAKAFGEWALKNRWNQSPAYDMLWDAMMNHTGRSTRIWDLLDNAVSCRATEKDAIAWLSEVKVLMGPGPYALGWRALPHPLPVDYLPDR